MLISIQPESEKALTMRAQAKRIQIKCRLQRYENLFRLRSSPAPAPAATAAEKANVERSLESGI